MTEFYPFFLIIFAGVFFSMVFKRMHVPWVVGLIIGGMLIGPNVFDLLQITPTVEFLSQVGLIFLMFMAGLETKFSSFKSFKGGLVWLSFINGAIPFIVGFGIAQYFGYEFLSSMLVGVIFVSSSIAVVIPSLERHGIIHSKLGQSVVMTTVIQDIASLLILSVILQSVSPVTSLPFIIFYPLVILTLFIFKYILPKVNNFFTKSADTESNFFQQEFRATLLILIGTVIVFELLGLHSIIAGFFAGLVLSDSLKSDVLKDRIRTVSYSIFIPTFFVIIGAQADISVLFNVDGALIFITAIVFGSILSKFFSGLIGARMVGFSYDQSLLFGISSVPQLSTTLAVALSALSFGLVDETLLTGMVILSIITVIVSPVLLNIFSERIKNTEINN